jgi:hypothetical protein
MTQLTHPFRLSRHISETLRPMSKRFLLSPACCLILFAVSSTQVMGQAPDQIAYQGYLQDGGTPIQNASATLGFTLYSSASSQSTLWTETQTGVQVTQGQFSVYLGSFSSLSSLPFDAPYWLGVTYDGTAIGPRMKLVSVPYARTAANAAGVPWNGITGVPASLADGVDNLAGDTGRNCKTFVIPYMPYSPNASQIMYLSQAPADWIVAGVTENPAETNDVTVEAIDDKGNVWPLGVVGSVTPGKVLKLTSIIEKKLQAAGFTAGKLAIGITMGKPANVYMYASYNAGSIRGFVPVECVQ